MPNTITNSTDAHDIHFCAPFLILSSQSNATGMRVIFRAAPPRDADARGETANGVPLVTDLNLSVSQATLESMGFGRSDVGGSALGTGER